jgi:hypothetical protein
VLLTLTGLLRTHVEQNVTVKPFLFLPQQLRQLGDIGGDPPRLAFAQSWRLLIREISQASSGRWMSLKLGTLVVSKLSMTFRQTKHFAASPSLLGTSEGVAE